MNYLVLENGESGVFGNIKRKTINGLYCIFFFRLSQETMEYAPWLQIKVKNDHHSCVVAVPAVAVSSSVTWTGRHCYSSSKQSPRLTLWVRMLSSVVCALFIPPSAPLSSSRSSTSQLQRPPSLCRSRVAHTLGEHIVAHIIQGHPTRI